MQSELIIALRARRPQVRERWRELLHAEPTSGPLGNPDALVHLIDWTLSEIFRGLDHLPSRRRLGGAASASEKPSCPCGRNPLLIYFDAGQQAMHEALVLAQSASASLDPIERDISLVELNLVLRHLARREIEAFCGVCQYREDEGEPAATDRGVAAHRHHC
jgi:hypothetical protein